MTLTANDPDQAEDVILNSLIESLPSNVAGEYDYQLITTAGTDINEIVIAMDTQLTLQPLQTAEELAQAIPYCSVVYYWDAGGQGTVGHPKGMPFAMFEVKAPYPYYANVTETTWWPYDPLNQPQTLVIAAKKTFLESVKQENPGGGIPHMAFNTFSHDYEYAINEENMRLIAWIESRPEEKLSNGMVGTGIEGKYWWIGVSNFPSSWSIGEILHVEIKDIANNLFGETTIQLTGAGFDKGEEIILKKTTDNEMFSGVPKEYVLLPCYPNPFNPKTTISYGLPRRSNVTIKIYDILGQTVKTLLDETKDAGYYKVIWDGKNDSGLNISAGLYLTVMSSPGYRKVEKMMLVK